MRFKLGNRLTTYVSCRLWALSVAICSLLGCEKRPEILVYKVPKESVPQTHRMFGAIVPHGEQAWFFKLTGDVDSMKDWREPFRRFVGELRFAEAPGATPQWNLPSGWEQLPGDQMRFATIRVPNKPTPLDLTVTTLPWRGESDALSASNINRWRGQLNLPRFGRSSLADHIETLDFKGGQAMLVDLVGQLKADSMKAPFAHTGSGSLRESISSAKPAARDPGIKFEQPEGWTKSRGSSLSVLAFEVISGQERIEVTVTQLSAAGAQLVPNINRWRSQVGLVEANESDIMAGVQKVNMGSIEASLVEIIGPPDRTPQRAILGAIGIDQDVAWFVKLTGDAALAQNEKKHFEEFVKSLQFE